jgi:hypothetical protein
MIGGGSLSLVIARLAGTFSRQRTAALKCGAVWLKTAGGGWLEAGKKVADASLP